MAYSGFLKIQNVVKGLLFVYNIRLSILSHLVFSLFLVMVLVWFSILLLLAHATLTKESFQAPGSKNGELTVFCMPFSQSLSHL
jgi:hypothetical protein